MSIYSNENIRKIAKLTPHELPQLVQNRENNSVYTEIMVYTVTCVHMREKISSSLRFSIPEQGEEAWLVSVFF